LEEATSTPARRDWHKRHRDWIDAGVATYCDGHVFQKIAQAFPGTLTVSAHEMSNSNPQPGHPNTVVPTERH
jgi:hypothetical protein